MIRFRKGEAEIVYQNPSEQKNMKLCLTMSANLAYNIGKSSKLTGRKAWTNPGLPQILPGGGEKQPHRAEGRKDREPERRKK